MKRAFKTELRLNKQQIRYCRLCCFATKLVYNWALDLCDKSFTDMMTNNETKAKQEGFSGEWNYQECKKYRQKWVDEYADKNNITDKKTKQYKEIARINGWVSISPTRNTLNGILKKAIDSNDPYFKTDWCANILKLVGSGIRGSALENFERAYKNFWNSNMSSSKPKKKKFVNSFRISINTTNENKGNPDLKLIPDAIPFVGPLKENEVSRYRVKVRIPSTVTKPVKLTPFSIKEQNIPINRISQATISNRANRWFISVLQDIPSNKSIATKEPIAVDLGINEYVTLTLSGIEKRYPTPLPLKNNLKKLQFLDYRMSRCKKVSSRYKSLKMRRAKFFLKTSNLRKEWLLNIVSKLTEHKDIYIEDLDVKAMVQSCRRKNVLDAAFGTFRLLLQSRCDETKSNLKIINKWYPSSKLCPKCNEKDKWDKEQGIRTCICGYSADRDYIGAFNLIRLHNKETIPVGFDSTGKKLPECVREVTGRESVLPEKTSKNAQEGQKTSGFCDELST